MGLKIGIVGLPNVGKSTTFNALTRAQNAETASYPFCTIKPNRAIVPVPDVRLDQLHTITARPEKIYATIEFVDIAGLVKGASKGEGLGNQFLGNIRDTDLIVHLIRCFEDPNVAHVQAEIDPAADIAVIDMELILADLEQLERKIERLESEVKGDTKRMPVLETARALAAHLDSGKRAGTFADAASDTFRRLNHELRLLTGKPLVYVANVDEEGLGADDDHMNVVRAVAAEEGIPVVRICAQLEEAMIDMEEEERVEMLALAGVEQSGLEQVIRLAYDRLGLISFFTMNENEVRAWTVPQGAKAPRAAGVIHTDFERGFIRAEVIPHDVFVKHGSTSAAKAAGAMRVEGKEYIVQDGDVIYFRFNV